MGFPKEDNERKTNFDLPFFLNKLEKNGFNVNREEIKIDKHVLNGINIEESYSLFNNGVLNILFIYTDEIHKKSIIRAARDFIKKRPFNTQFIFSDRKEALLITFADGADGEARILHLEDHLYHTDEEVLKSLRYSDDIKELAVLVKGYLPYEKVREEFFEGYREKFQDLLSLLKRHALSEKESNAYAQRFLGRLMFLYFLQKKGWLAGNRRFIDTISDYRQLNEVFYNGLNNLGNSMNLPYLNGSLFDREDYITDDFVDKVSEDMTSFFTRARSFFNRYNFTVDESTPSEVEVSIDPYLLGTVFENMLPEHERGNKGTFYTPPAEISFIVRRAISNYLFLNGFDTNDKVVDGKLQDGIEQYISNLAKSKNLAELQLFEDKLLNAVTVDPAVGSGGFLVYYMDEVSRIINEAEIAVLGTATPPKILKEKILENVYGFDIESEAAEIARLRIWLSYVIDEDNPRPLPNLDINLVTVSDSLESLSFANFSPTVKDLRRQYVHESDKAKKKELKESIRKEIQETFGIKGSEEYVEYYLMDQANIIIMNPPYVRYQKIPENKKASYSKYGLDSKSDLYAYFFKRALNLLSPKGVVSVISSDKWLETGYGLSLQKYLKKGLLAIYGQKQRSFGADINTVISVFTNEMLKTPVEFNYLNSYSSTVVKNNISIESDKLNPGKWFYLRAPKLFVEKILPKFTYKLGDFAEINYGVNTYANNFFYMTDISSQYDIDYAANPEKFENWGVTARNENELREQGLIYTENEGGERFVINRPDTAPLVRTPKELKEYKIKEVRKLCLFTNEPGKFTKKYIAWGEKQLVKPRGQKDPVIGYNNLTSVSKRKKWYSINEIEPSNIISPKFVMDRFFVSASDYRIICDNILYTIKSKVKNIIVYLNSTLFYITMELYLRRLGGGVGEIMVKDYEQIPVPDFNKLDLSQIEFFPDREMKRYFEEIKMEDRRKLDSEILRAMGVQGISLDDLYKEFVELVEDRLVKADRPLKRLERRPEKQNQTTKEEPYNEGSDE